MRWVRLHILWIVSKVIYLSSYGTIWLARMIGTCAGRCLTAEETTKENPVVDQVFSDGNKHANNTGFAEGNMFQLP